MTAVEDYLESRGEYRRAILLRGRPGRVDAELEDNVHHFTATLWHDGGRVLRMDGDSFRIPYATCGAGSAQMRALAGAPLSDDPRAAYGFTDVRRQCTHAFQLAGHAMAHALRGDQVWLYEVAVQDDVPEEFTATVHLNRQAALEWRLKGDVIDAPASLAGVNTAEAAKRAMETDHTTGEAAVILHRAMRQAIAQRRVTHLAQPYAGDLSTRGNCYTFQPNRAPTSKSLDMTRNFEREGVWPLRDKALQLQAEASL